MNKDRLIALCHKISNEKQVDFNVVLTYYFLETILAKIASSPYSHNFVFKGGFLLSNIIGVESRTTSDMDFILEQFKMDKSLLESTLKEILTDDLVHYEITKISEIKDEDPYGGYRIHILCRLDNIRQTIPLDIATGDPITPKSVSYRYHSLFQEIDYEIVAYNLETILAEKLETIYRRSFFNTRSKDFYDVYVIYSMEKSRLDSKNLRSSCEATFSYRQTTLDVVDFQNMIDEMKDDITLARHWENYQSHYPYATSISFRDVLEVVQQLLLEL